MMRSTDEWHGLIAAETSLPSYVARQLRDIGFVVMPGPDMQGIEELSEAYDRAVAMAEPADVSIRSPRRASTTSSIVGRSSTVSMYTARCWLRVARSSMDLSSSAACVVGRSSRVRRSRLSM